MEKIVYQLWKQDSDSLEEFKNFLLIDLPNTLKSPNALKVHIKAASHMSYNLVIYFFIQFFYF